LFCYLFSRTICRDQPKPELPGHLLFPSMRSRVFVAPLHSLLITGSTRLRSRPAMKVWSGSKYFSHRHVRLDLFWCCPKQFFPTELPSPRSPGIGHTPIRSHRTGQYQNASVPRIHSLDHHSLWHERTPAPATSLPTRDQRLNMEGK